MKRIVLGMLIVIGILVSKGLEISNIDLKTAQLICLGIDGVEQVDVGGYIICGDSKIYDESELSSRDINIINDGYRYICSNDIIRGIDLVYGDSYSIKWFNPIIGLEEVLKCKHFELYKSIYMVSDGD